MENFAEALPEFRNFPRPDGYLPAQLMFGQCMRTALPAARGALEPIPLKVVKQARKKIHNSALAGIGNHRLEKFHVREEVWVRNRITGAWDKEAFLIGQAQWWCLLLPLFPGLR